VFRYYALIVAIVTFVYLYLTVRMAQWRADIRRDMVNMSREEDAVKNDSMIAYETVKYFNAEDYEFRRYRNAVKAYQKAEYRVLLSLNVMNVSQNVVFTLGLLVACFLAAYQVNQGDIKVGGFVALLAYLAQLQVRQLVDFLFLFILDAVLQYTTLTRVRRIGPAQFLRHVLPEYSVFYDKLGTHAGTGRCRAGNRPFAYETSLLTSCLVQGAANRCRQARCRETGDL